jgi:hypothetical protein
MTGLERIQLNNSNKEDQTTRPTVAKWSGQVNKSSKKLTVSQQTSDESRGDE